MNSYEKKPAPQPASASERAMLMIFTILGLGGVCAAIALMGLAMHFLSGD